MIENRNSVTHLSCILICWICCYIFHSSNHFGSLFLNFSGNTMESGIYLSDNKVKRFNLDNSSTHCSYPGHTLSVRIENLGFTCNCLEFFGDFDFRGIRFTVYKIIQSLDYFVNVDRGSGRHCVFCHRNLSRSSKPWRSGWSDKER